MMRRAALLLLLAAAACQPAPRAESPDAAPPSSASPGDSGIALRLHPSLPPHRFVVHARGTQVDSVIATGGGGARQKLRPHENGLPEGLDLPRLSTIDVDFDGYADVALLTRVALANSWSEYWRYHPARGGFVRLGEFPTLRPDSAARELTAFNRGGHGGRLWTAWRYRVMEGRIQVIREEAQDFLDGPGRYVRIIREPRGMELAEVGRDTLEDHEVRAGPSWEKEP